MFEVLATWCNVLSRQTNNKKLEHKVQACSVIATELRCAWETIIYERVKGTNQQPYMHAMWDRLCEINF